MELQSSDPPISPEKARSSDQITIKTPKKLSNPRPRIKNPRHFSPLPDKYETLLKLFDALDASLKLLLLRKSVPLFGKIRVMVETLSDRRFTYHHLAQLKFLLPEEIGVRKVLFPDDETRCMTHDLHLTINNSVTNPKKRKRGSKYSYLRELLSSKLSQFFGAHPEGAEIPEEELPEPFNQREQDHLLNPIKKSSSFSCSNKVSSGDIQSLPARASHLSVSFKKHFSKRSLSNRTENTPQGPPMPPSHSPSVANLFPDEMLDSDSIMSRTELFEQPAMSIRHKTSADGESSSPKVAETRRTPLKSGGTPIKPATPALQIPKICHVSPDSSIVSSPCKSAHRSSCARSLVFEGPSSVTNVELQLDEDECSDILDILPESVLASLKEKEGKKAAKTKRQHMFMQLQQKEKEEKTAAEAKRKQMVVQLPKLFNRILFLFQGPSKSAAIRKEVLVRDLTERHSDITDESEIEEQLRLLQEVIPEWIVHKFSPSGNILYSINKALKPDSLRRQLDRAV